MYYTVYWEILGVKFAYNLKVLKGGDVKILNMCFLVSIVSLAGAEIEYHI